MKYMLLSHDQNSGHKRDIKISNRSFENVAQFIYFGTTVTNQNLINEKIKSRLNFANACYHSVQNLLSYCMMPKAMKYKIYKTTILTLVLYWYET
jgi:hypothetical protein